MTNLHPTSVKLHGTGSLKVLVLILYKAYVYALICKDPYAINHVSVPYNIQVVRHEHIWHARLLHCYSSSYKLLHFFWQWTMHTFIVFNRDASTQYSMHVWYCKLNLTAGYIKINLMLYDIVS